MNTIAIIPARGGSKRIPKKNIKLFQGKEIIAYSIEAAIKSTLFDEVMVSTDDPVIKKIAINYGAKVPFKRSKKNSDDFATTYDVIEEVLLNYRKKGINFRYACCIYSCAPFVTDKKITKAYKILKNNNLDTVFPIMNFGFPIQRAIKRIDEVKVAFVNPVHSLTRSQDLEKMYHDAGQFYWIDCEKCLAQKKLIGNNTGSIIISEMEGQDIDNAIDWKIAELKYEILQKSE